MINVNHPIIFLDVDGPLASQDYMHRVHCNGGDTNEDRIDPLCCNNLQRLVDITDAHVVISSTWRKFPHDVYDLMKFFCNYNIPVIGMTPNSATGHREEEINAWLKSHYVIHNCFVIIDDDQCDLQTLKDHLVKVDGYRGMNGDNTDEAARIIEQFRRNLDAVKDLSSIERLRIFKEQNPS